MCFCVHTIHATPSGPCTLSLSPCVCLSIMPCLPVVTAKTMSHSTIISKICLVSVGYLSTTTVMQSVATTSSDITGQFLHQRCISRVDAQKPYPPSLMVICMILQAVHSSAKQIWWSDVGLNPYTKYMTIMSHFLEVTQI